MDQTSTLREEILARIATYAHGPERSVLIQVFHSELHENWAVSVLAVAFVAAAIIYLFLGHYTQRATLQGTLVPASGLVTLNAASAGDVPAVDVHQGERVSAGQTLASVDNPLESAALGNTLAFITAELNIERKGLEQDPATQRADLRPGARRAHLVGGRLGAQGAVQCRDAGGFHRLCGSVASAGARRYLIDGTSSACSSCKPSGWRISR